MPVILMVTGSSGVEEGEGDGVASETDILPESGGVCAGTGAGVAEAAGPGDCAGASVPAIALATVATCTAVPVAMTRCFAKFLMERGIRFSREITDARDRHGERCRVRRPRRMDERRLQCAHPCAGNRARHAAPAPWLPCK